MQFWVKKGVGKMEMSFRLANTMVSLRVNRFSQTRPKGLGEDRVLKRVVREENIRKVLAERERLVAKITMTNRFPFF
jgi:hypothetical protein